MKKNFSLFHDCLSWVSDANGSNHVVKQSIIQRARLEAIFSTILICLKEPERRGGQVQIANEDTFTSHVSEELNQLIGKVNKCVQTWDPVRL